MLAESLRGVIAQSLFPREDKDGRVAAIEVLKNTSAVANLIRENKTYQIPSVMQTGRAQGMITFDTSVTQLVKEGKISQITADQFLGNTSTAAKETSAPASPAAKPGKTKAPAKPAAAGGIKIYDEEKQNTGIMSGLGFGKKKTG